jgi:surfeit locus 1 family protein
VASLPSPVMRSDLLRPRALLTHLLVLAVAVACVTLGLWQLDRLAELRASNALAAVRMAEPPADLAALANPASSAAVDEEALEFRRVAVRGTFRPDEEVLQRGQQHPFSGQAGFHVLTPLELTDGGVVLVRRGWVPATLSEPPVAEAVPPPGEVTVEGVLERPVEQPGFGPQDPPDGHLDRVFHTDTARLASQVDGALFPMVLRIDAAPPAASVSELPVTVGPPVLDERNHFSYAMQWFAFAMLAVVTYGAWLWTRQRRRSEAPPDGGASSGPDGGTGHAPDSGARAGADGTSRAVRPLEGTPGAPAER